MTRRRFAAACLVSLAACTRRAAPLPILSTLPDFTLTDEAGRPFTKRDLAGHVWVADFIFTNCPGACLRMSKQMQQIQAANAKLRLVSFSVDPARDTPRVLAAYARRNQADPARWRFLTGDVQKVAEASLLGAQSLDHSTRFLLFDGEGNLRATYQSDEPDAVARLLKDATSLQGE